MSDDQPLPLQDEPHRAAVEELVIAALERHEQEGEAGVVSLLEGHPELASDVRRRLARLARMGLLDRGALGEGLPERVGDYRIEALIGEGGMGVVYRARDDELGRSVALKVLRPELLLVPGARERVRREATAAAQLAHPGVAALHRFGEHEGVPWLAMELVEGRSLAQILEAVAEHDGDNLDGATLVPGSDDGWTRACLRVARDVARALEHAHGRRVLHRDVKPSNVIVTDDGRARLVDFGLARIDGAARLTRTGTRLGSLQYMAPEQLAAASDTIDGRADVFSLGATLYELLTLQSPFAAPSPEETMRRIREGQLLPPRRLAPSLSRDVEAVVLKALATDPARRYATATALADDLDNLLALRPVSASPLGHFGVARLWLRRRPRIATGLGVALVAMVVAGATLAIQERRATTRVAAQREQADRNAASVRRLLTDLTLSLRTRLDIYDALDSAALSELATVETPAAFLPDLRDTDPLLVARSRLLLGAAAQARGDWSATRVHLNEAITALDRVPRDRNRGLLLLAHAMLGDLHEILGDRRACLDSYRDALEIYEQLERERQTEPADLGTVIGVLGNRAYLARIAGRLDDFERDVRRGREIAADAPDTPDANMSVARLEFEEAWMRMLADDLPVARRAAARAGAALERFEGAGVVLPSPRLRYHRLLALLANMEGDEPAALAELATARQFLPTVEAAAGDYFCALQRLMFTDQWGQSLRSGPELLEATTECDQALELALERHSNIASICEVGLNVAARQCARWEALGDVERARADIERAVGLLDDAVRPTERADALLSLGIASSNLGDDDRAIAFLEQALEVVESPQTVGTTTALVLERSTANILARLGTALLRAGRPAEALVVLERADGSLRELVDRAPSTNERRSLASVGQELANIAIDEGDFDRSAERLTRSLAWLDPQADAENADPWLRLERAWQTFSLIAAHMNRGARDEGWEVIDRALAFTPQIADPELAYEIGLIATQSLRVGTPHEAEDIRRSLDALEQCADFGLAAPDRFAPETDVWAPLQADERFAPIVERIARNAAR
ncbi:serine/threonine-protein kinase [Engelhardtia mirabilis]|uniref:Serine/threonine-protein kinase PknB n=1 Tax=Engelhardtia mirabilis TaxID=2528011 RepID=A0A518BFQ2_9BACT|nr:Serine/threonine-protein kinase PknB [Planctomycetes bacterium Pla133]QDV00124.1 Serine/threonine-protein kinase PknB [Planctomycetes bacterium Pla86]